MHSSLAVTLDGLPLGLSAKKFWTRTKFKGTAALKKKISPTRVPIEEKESFRWLENMRQSIALFGDPARCIHVGDRKSDIYELFCTAHELGTHFLVRTCVDRLAGDGEHTIATEMTRKRSAGCMRSRFAMPRASLRPSRSRSNTAASRACRRSASRSAIPRSTSPCCTPRSVRNQSIGQGSTGS